MKQCPRCASVITKNDKVCPKCKLETSRMAEYAKLQGLQFDEHDEDIEDSSSLETQKPKTKAERKREKKEAKKQAKIERRLRESKSDTDFSKFAKNSDKNLGKQKDNSTYLARRKNKKEIESTPQFELDENGEFNIDTSDVELVGEETGKIIEQVHSNSYSVKKARGDYHQPKIKWWEIYKLADRAFARRKIKKEVNKAAMQKPDFINKTKLLLLAIFLGWSGAHNFYAKNKKKGWFSVAMLIIWIGVFALSSKVMFFAKISISVGGCAGFINLFIWFSDIISIITNRFKYRLQKEAFIFGMNVETRAKLSEKYIDLELYQKPWWVKFKVWCERTKRNMQESKRKRKQEKIEREKQKLEEAEKKAKIDAEIAEYEAKETEKLSAEQYAKIVEDDVKSVVENNENLTEKQLKQSGIENKKSAKTTQKTQKTGEGYKSNKQKPRKYTKTKNKKN